MLKTTPFHPRTASLSRGQAWRRWAGYVAASAYELTHEHEYSAIRSSAALLDVTPLYKYRISGRHAGAMLDRVVTRNVARCRAGQVMYTPWCTAEGKVIDDGTLTRLDERTFRLTSAEPNLRWLSLNAVGFDVEIEDISDSTAALAVQGPRSRDTLRTVAGDDVVGLGYFRMMPATIAGRRVEISRTGYTGDLGYEIWLDNGDAEAVWDAIVEGGEQFGLTPAGLLALDVARMEAGLILMGVDYVSAHKALVETQFSSPFELNLGWAVSADKGPFVGRAALRAERTSGPAWQFVGLEIDWVSLEALYAEAGLPPRQAGEPWRTSVPIYRGRRQVGYATSGCWSPVLKRSIALAHVESPHAAPGTRLTMELTVEHHRRRAEARVAKLPFFDPPRKRS